MEKADWREERVGNIPIPEEFVPFAQELRAESDRGMALSGTAYLDDRLGKLIEVYLAAGNPEKLIWDSNAPVGMFSARIVLAHALGLVSDKERNQLNMLRKVRNLFAHDFKIKMDDPVVVGTMGNFRELVDVEWDPTYMTLLDVKFAETPRDQFFHAVLRLAHQLDVRKWVVEDEGMRLEPIDWREHYF